MSELNPYAAPGSDAGLLSTGGTNLGEPLPWDIGSALSAGWELFKQHWGIVLGTGVLGYVVAAVAVVPSIILKQAGFDTLAAVVQQVLSMAAGAFIGIGLTRIWLDAVRGRTPRFESLFSGGDRFVVAFGVQVLATLAMLAGLIALVVGAFVVALGLSFAMVIAADTDKGVVDCLKESWRATTGHKLSLFGFGIVLGLVNVAGMIPCGLGLFVTIPMSVLAWTWVYTRITGTPSVA